MKRALIAVGLALLLGYAVLLGLRPPPPKPRAFVLTAQTIALPEDPSTLPPGPNQALATANCTSCHSASMMTTQPPLKHEQWAATVKKMQEVYKAPIAEEDVSAILAYLDSLSARAAASR